MMESTVHPVTSLGGQTVLSSPLTDRPSCMFSMATMSTSPHPSPLTPGNKSLRMSMKENAREVSQCRRRLDFSPHQTYLGFHRPPTVAVARRNERERNRVKLINMTFATLREHLPHGSKGTKSKKMSKVETLRSAIEYIRHLQGMIGDPDAMRAVLEGSRAMIEGACSMSPESCLSPTPSTSSPSPSPCSTDSSYETLTIDEDDLIDFANWF
ncbi:achaete-scute homolog 1a-like [Haliotis asinina]|uniref:achaete-scute homolog 1a-like n=1 Tax=Haliotis asinina TaxID=109174 RepID=UPI0035321866